MVEILAWIDVFEQKLGKCCNLLNELLITQTYLKSFLQFLQNLKSLKF